MNPIKSAPGVILHEQYLQPLGITPHALAMAMRTSDSGVRKICAGERIISPDIALRLAVYFSTLPPDLVPAGHHPDDPSFWLDLQRDFDLSEAANSERWREQSGRVLRWRSR